MNERALLQKIVFTYSPDDRLIQAVRDVLPEAIVAVANDDEALSREVVDAQMTIGSGFSDSIRASAPGLVWHHVPWAGVESIITPTLRERGTALTNSSGISAPNMAEHAIAFMLSFARAFPTFYGEQQRRKWRDWDERPTYFELTDQTVVLLGAGAIGKAIAVRLRPFGCRIIGVRRQIGPIDGFDAVISFDQLPRFLPEADHVVSSLPMTTFTDKIVDREFIAQMKPGSYFHNVGRGGTVDQDALIEALHSGHLAGAGLDVANPEPLPENSPLWDAPNTILTGHTSGNSPKFTERGAELLRANLQRYVSGEDLLNVVDLEQGY